MQTKLSRYCDGVMEASWLAAVVIIPVFFNVYSSRIFEPDKISILRTLALVILTAWVIKLIDQKGFRWNQDQRGGSRFLSLLNVPLVLPVMSLVLVYLLSTVLSVTPWVSLWGSYQRLQGTYTTFSYVVIFAAMLANLRRRLQVERLFTTVIASSLPVSLYGVLQHYKVDPIPWGGDVTIRIAANMGNSIFVGAYFILVFPLVVMRIVESFQTLLRGDKVNWSDFARATIYVFIGALNVISLYFTGSRGPWLGWAASLVFIWLGLSLIWRARWMTFSGVALFLSAAVFLIVLNIPNGPLSSLRTVPGLGRLGQLLDAESRTGRVRQLIWKGAVELVRPHSPLEFPDGSKDTFNFLRPLIGYGPESMYVAYNRFYPPELTQVEKRNASPDRSHNETWDSLVITGLLGLFVYLTLFGSVLYYGMKWLGLIGTRQRQSLFWGLYISCGVLSAALISFRMGFPYIGVALPFGMIMGVIFYLIFSSLAGGGQTRGAIEDRTRAYVILALLSAIVAHYVEINFGIAIAATRTYFWVYSALLVLVGTVLPRYGEYVVESGTYPDTLEGESSENESESPVRREERVPIRQEKARDARKKRRPQRNLSSIPENRIPRWLSSSMETALIMGLLLATLGYNYISNASRANTPLALIWNSLSRLGAVDNQPSWGILGLVATTWLAGCILMNAENLRALTLAEHDALNIFLKAFATSLAVSGGLALLFWVWHASELAALINSTARTVEDVLAQVRNSESILTVFYVFILALVFILGYFLPEPSEGKSSLIGGGKLTLAAGSFIVAFALTSFTNLRVIQADIAFKTADIFTHADTWPVAISIYNLANKLAPNEDYYYLFLGRAYLEYARSLEDQAQRDQLIEQAARDLRQAQRLNPLNTDHTANLARLYSLWAAYTSDANQRQERAEISDNYFSRALILSPNNARLWDEWASLFLNVLKQPDKGYQLLQKALEVDPYYDWTYGLIGDYYLRFQAADETATLEAKQLALERAVDNYKQAVKLSGSSDLNLQYSYAVSLGNALAQLGRFSEAISAYEHSLDVVPDPNERWKVELTISRLYSDLGDKQNALLHAQVALSIAPDNQKSAIQAQINQITNQP